MKVNRAKSMFWVRTLFCLLPLLLGMALYGQLPAQIPSHWGADGQVNGYLPKPWAVFGLPLFFAGLHALLSFAMNVDPKRENIGRQVKAISIWICPALSLILLPYSYAWALGWQEIPLEKLLPVLLGLMFMVIGNYLPKCQQNYTSGIKLPWTLHDEDNWAKTHRLAGRLWLFGGMLMAVSAFWGGQALWLAALILMVALPVAYSYLLYRKAEQRENGGDQE